MSITNKTSGVKITRFGHRQANKGVITIASEVLDDKIYFGVSYCSPKEKHYDKQKGNLLALHDLAGKKSKDEYTFFDKPLTNSNVIVHILLVLFDDQSYPRWAEPLLVEAYNYPRGLKRFDKSKEQDFQILDIVVNSQEAKTQLIKALNYIHFLPELDSNFVMVDQLIHVYMNPDVISVRD